MYLYVGDLVVLSFQTGIEIVEGPWAPHTAVLTFFSCIYIVYFVMVLQVMWKILINISRLSSEYRAEEKLRSSVIGYLCILQFSLT